MRSISPLRYPGGKTQVYEFVRELIELNGSTTYIEPYMGGMGIALKLILDNKVDKIMVNDYDKSIYAFWYSVLNYTDNLIHLIETTPISIEEWKNQRRIQDNKNSSKDLLALGFSTLFLNRTNRSGIIKAGVIGGLQQNGNYKLDCRFNKERIIQNIKLIASMREKIKLYNMDAEKFIRLNISKTKNSFTFFDPPYYAKGPGLYTNFYSHGDHKNLSNYILRKMKNRKWIVTYDNVNEVKDMYRKIDKIEFKLQYTLQNKCSGSEVMFFSNKVLRPDEESKMLNII